MKKRNQPYEKMRRTPRFERLLKYGRYSRRTRWVIEYMLEIENWKKEIRNGT